MIKTNSIQKKLLIFVAFTNIHSIFTMGHIFSGLQSRGQAAASLLASGYNAATQALPTGNSQPTPTAPATPPAPAAPAMPAAHVAVPQVQSHYTFLDPNNNPSQQPIIKDNTVLIKYPNGYTAQEPIKFENGAYYFFTGKANAKRWELLPQAIIAPPSFYVLPGYNATYTSDQVVKPANINVVYNIPLPCGEHLLKTNNNGSITTFNKTSGKTSVLYLANGSWEYFGKPLSRPY